VRLRYAYFVRCVGAAKDPKTGEVTELHCTYDPATRGGDAPDGRKVDATLHWVSAAHALTAEVRLYERLFDDAVIPKPRSRYQTINPDRAVGFHLTSVLFHCVNVLLLIKLLVNIRVFFTIFTKIFK
jgi:hypothetical protein